MSEPAAQTHEIVCPHCGKPFQGDVLSRGTRHEGFKCPHCRLVVPVDRVEDDGSATPD
jgi:DNA-directed RNA polymerase subunit RPC12/RpoP